MITNEERDLVFRIAQGDKRIIYRIGHIRMVCEDTKNGSYMPILRWLSKSKIIGQDFISWFDEKHKGSVLNAISYARMMAFNDVKKRKLISKYR